MPTVKRRRYLVLPALVFGVSLLLPSLKVFDGYAAGYVAAACVETAFCELSVKAISSLAAGSLAFPVTWTDDFPIWSGMRANHLFVLAYIARLFRRFRLASLLAANSALCAVACLLPEQLFELFGDGRWCLGPGYFVWCAAPMTLAIATFRAFRATRVGVQASEQ